MRIRVTYTSQLRVAAGVETESIEFDSSPTVLDVARAASERHGDALRDLLLNDERALHRWIMLSVNDGACFDHDRRVENEDEVLFASPISGG